MDEYENGIELVAAFKNLEFIESLSEDLKLVLKKMKTAMIMNLIAIILNLIMIVFMAVLIIFFNYPFLLGYIFFLNYSWSAYRLFNIFKDNMSNYSNYKYKLRFLDEGSIFLKNKIESMINDKMFH